MKLHFLHKELSSNIKFTIYEKEEFLKLWHHHPELELVYIVEGEGTLYAGDFIGRYQKNDVFLLGKNVPHMFHSNPPTESGSFSKSYVFHINDALLNASFDELPEFSFLQHIKDISKRGVLFRQNDNDNLLEVLEKLKNDSPSKNAIKVFQVLLHLSDYQEYVSLGTLDWLDRFRIDDKRINNIVEYTMLHFKEDIKLEEIAAVSGMNKSAFCRYFKKSTGKTFINFLNETRINYSCKLLQESSPKKSISAACYESGFNSLSYYNRAFKKVMRVSPTQYQAEKRPSISS